MGALQLPHHDPPGWLPESEPPRLVPVPAREPAAAPLRRLSRAEALRRRRLLALVGASLLALGAVAAGKALLAAEPSPSPSLEPVSMVDGNVYVVQPGDTLWTIARRLAPDGDPRPLVAELRSVHGAAELDVGDRLDLASLVD